MKSRAGIQPFWISDFFYLVHPFLPFTRSENGNTSTVIILPPSGPIPVLLHDRSKQLQHVVSRLQQEM
jgi:hypothetical protein